MLGGRYMRASWQGKLTVPVLAVFGVLLVVLVLFSTVRNALAHVLVQQRLPQLAVLMHPTDAGIYFSIGNHYFSDEAYNTQKAVRNYRLALQFDPSLQGPHYQLARIYFIQGNFTDALYEINRELAQHPEYMRAHYTRGLIYGYIGDLERAASDFEAFVTWKPDSWAGHNDLAWVQFQQGRYADAAETAQRGLAITPDNPWLLNSLGVAQLNLGLKEDARVAFTKAQRIAETMAPKDWGVAYPGNDPAIYAEGLDKMKSSLTENLLLTNDVDSAKVQ